MHQILDENKNYSLVAVDFDRTLISGHMHQYLAVLFTDMVMNEVIKTIQNFNDEEFAEFLWEVAVFGFLESKLGFANSKDPTIRKKIVDIFLNPSVDIVEELSKDYVCDFRSIPAFSIPKEEWKKFLEYRDDNGLKTVIISNSAFPDLIKRTLKFVMGTETEIQVITPELDNNKTFRNLYANYVSAMFKSKAVELQKLYNNTKIKCAVFDYDSKDSYRIEERNIEYYTDVCLIDDEQKNVCDATAGGFSAFWLKVTPQVGFKAKAVESLPIEMAANKSGDATSSTAITLPSGGVVISGLSNAINTMSLCASRGNMLLVERKEIGALGGI